MTTEQVEKAANVLSQVFRRITFGLLVRAEEPLPTLDLEQMYTAIRIVDSEADVHVVADVIVPAGYSGWIELPLPTDRICCQRYGLEWGDPVVKLKWSIDTKERVACNLHNISPTPAHFEYAKYWVKRNRLYLYYENTDTVNAAEFHLNVLAVICRASDWDDRWGPKIKRHAEGLLE
jgi:hypothetical protein